MTQQMTIQQAIDLGVQHHQAGRFAEAESIYRQVLASQPQQPDALHLLGLLMMKANQTRLAVDLIRAATQINPAVAQYHNSLGQALAETGAVEPAMQSFWLALALKPDFPEALNSVGIALKTLGKTEKAIESFREALRQRPHYPDALSNLGNALQSQGKIQEAIECYKQALALRPDDPAACSNLANVLQSEGQASEAIELYRKAVTGFPRFADAWCNLGIALHDLGRFDEAEEAIRKTLEINPDSAIAHYHLATNRLRRGDFQQGWEELEWSNRLPDMHRISAGLPTWDGGKLNGKRILLFCEQGFSGVIHFARYAPMVAEQCGGKVILACSSELLHLMRSLRGTEAVVDQLGTVRADVQFPLISLPRIFKTDLHTIPAPIPYLSADPTRSAAIRERLANMQGKKVGLVWAGRHGYRTDRIRSIPFDLLRPLLGVPDLQFVSLQKGKAAHAMRESMAQENILDLTDELNDFADTAALIDHLDLVISVDTAVAHLAGAMGKPTWLLLPFASDWRWMLDRPDSPWYPTMRLFRQKSLGNWNSVIESVNQELARLG